jgi:hypothetical protein
MAATIYLVSSVTFATTAIAGAISMRVSRGGSELDTRSNGELGATAVALTDLRDTVVVSFKNLALEHAIGAAGALVVACKPHSGGVTLGNAKTMTATGAVLIDIQEGADQGDGTSYELTFRVPFQSGGLLSNIDWA